MGKLKQEVIKAVKEGGGRSFPVMGENDFKGRLDRVEAILEVQSGIVLSESVEPAKKASKKAGFARFGLLVVLVMSMFCGTVMARQLFNLVDKDRTSVFSVDTDDSGSATVTVATVSSTGVSASGDITASGSSQGEALTVRRTAKVLFGSADWNATTGSILSVNIPTGAVIKDAYLRVTDPFGVATNDSTANLTLGINTLEDLLTATNGLSSISDTGSLVTADLLVATEVDAGTESTYIVKDSAWAGIVYSIDGANATSGALTIYIDYDL